MFDVNRLMCDVCRWCWQPTSNFGSVLCVGQRRWGQQTLDVSWLLCITQGWCKKFMLDDSAQATVDVHSQLAVPIEQCAQLQGMIETHVWCKLAIVCRKRAMKERKMWRLLGDVHRSRVIMMVHAWCWPSTGFDQWDNPRLQSPGRCLFSFTNVTWSMCIGHYNFA